MKKLIQHLRSSDRNRLFGVIGRMISNSIWILVLFDWVISSKKDSLRLEEVNSNLPRMFIYVHHSDSGTLDLYDERVLKEAKLNGFATILFSNKQLEKNQYVDYCFQKNRFGRDFAVLRNMARILKFNSNQRIDFFYLNDSMIWQVNGISTLCSVFDKAESNLIIFPTESLNPTHHVQPFFLFAKLDKEKFHEFSISFEWIKNLHFKRSLIYLNEYRIARKLLERNWNIKILAPYWEILNAENNFRKNNSEQFYDSSFKFYNPTQHFWRMLPSFQIQAVKKSLIHNNPVGIANPPSSVSSALKTLRA
jgi:hypothetical protein